MSLASVASPCATDPNIRTFRAPCFSAIRRISSRFSRKRSSINVVFSDRPIVVPSSNFSGAIPLQIYQGWPIKTTSRGRLRSSLARNSLHLGQTFKECKPANIVNAKFEFDGHCRFYHLPSAESRIYGLYVQIDGFIDKNEFKKQIDEWIHVFRNTKPAPGTNGPLIPGDPEREAESIRIKEGIPLLKPVVDDLLDISRKTGIAFEAK